MGVTQSFEAAWNKARNALWQGSPTSDGFLKGPDLLAGDYLESLSVAGRAGKVLRNIGRDTSDRLRVGAAYRNPLGTPFMCRIQANGKIATGAFFSNFSDAEHMEITKIEQIHSVANGAALTCYVSKDGAGVAPGAGDAIMSNTFDLNATANTKQTGTLNGVPGNATRGNTISGTSKLLIGAGETLSLKLSGAVTSLAGLCIMVWVREFTGQPPAQLFLTGNGDIATMTMYLNVIPGQVVRGVAMRWSTAATNGGAVTADVTKDTGTAAAGAGTSVLLAAQSVKGTINTTVFPALAASAATLTMAFGDRLAIKMTGTLTALAGLVVTVFFQESFQDMLAISLPTWDAPLTSRVAFMADRHYEAFHFAAIWGVASSSGTVTETVDRTTTAPGAGTAELTGTISTAGTANTTGEGSTVVAARSAILIAPGDRVSLLHGGTTTNLLGTCATALLKAA